MSSTGTASGRAEGVDQDDDGRVTRDGDGRIGGQEVDQLPQTGRECGAVTGADDVFGHRKPPVW
ncbi:hypothetical protein ACFWFH_13630 [Streptomyces coelicoflavus]|uniref:hypothetical protein n=1 Tax=Streptomyces TaxID=1883 RepID=UPI00188535C8|nr:hypothetical protein [Streptomyces sp. SYP-A7193]